MDLDPDDHQDSYYNEEGITQPWILFAVTLCYLFFLFPLEERYGDALNQVMTQLNGMGACISYLS